MAIALQQVPRRQHFVQDGVYGRKRIAHVEAVATSNRVTSARRGVCVVRESVFLLTAKLSASAGVASVLALGTRRPRKSRTASSWQRGNMMASIRTGFQKSTLCAVGKTSGEQGPALLPEADLVHAAGPAVVWFRVGDLRVRDHPGLVAAAASPGGAVCCFIFSPTELARLSPRRLAALRAAVDSLSAELRARCGAPLYTAIAEDGAAHIQKLCTAVGASDVFVHDDPVDVNRWSLVRLRGLCAGDSLRIQTWRAPLRKSAGALGSNDAYDAYSTAISSIPLEAPLPAPDSVDAPTALASRTHELDGFTEVLPGLEELEACVAAHPESACKAALRQRTSYVRGLGADDIGEAATLRLIERFVSSGPEALAEELWGPPEGVASSTMAADFAGDVPASKEEWCFRRVSRTSEGYTGLIPGEVFSRAFSEALLWLGCVSLRTAAEHVQKADKEVCDTVSKVLEANEWHRLLALRDLSGHLDEGNEDASCVQIRYWRWRGYLVRYMAPTWYQATASSASLPLLAVHGFAASCTQFEGVARELANDVPVYALDMVGFGHSEKPPLSFSQYLWEQCVKSFALEVVGEPVALMGNSIGGYVSQAAAASLGPAICPRLVLLNSAGPVLAPDAFETSVREAGGTVLQRMRRGYGDDVGLQSYSPPPQWLVDLGAGFLFGLLQPRIESILKGLYPSNAGPTGPLAHEILRDSKDPFATNVVASFSRLGPSRSTNELFAEYARGDNALAPDSSSDTPKDDRIPTPGLLVCQGMADLLGGGPGNQPSRMQNFVTICPNLKGKAVPLEGRGHCPHHEDPGNVAAAVRSWLKEAI